MTTEDKLNQVYSERNGLAIAFAKAALQAGWKAGRGFDNCADTTWDDSWRHVVYIQLPDGRQVSYHIAPDQVPLLDGLPTFEGEWDGTFLGREPNEWVGTL